jgi:amino acid adenylation domain-containing protein
MENSSANLDNAIISVIIPAYNSAQYLPEAIDSVFSQTHSGCEIIVVDDGSTDETKIVCAKYSTVKYVYQSNQGLPAARNNGVEASSGQYLVFLDSDDCLLPSAIEIGLQAMQEHPEVGFVFGRYLYQLARTDGSFVTENTFADQPKIASYATILADRHRTQSACCMFQRDVFEAVGGYNRELWALEDIDLLLRIAQDFPIYYHQQIVSEYRIRDQNMSSKSAAMLVGAVYGHRLQRSYVEQHPEYAEAYEEGERVWIKLFGDRILYDVIGLAQQGDWVAALGLVRLVLTYDPHVKIVDREVYEVAGETLFDRLRQSGIQLSGISSSDDLQMLLAIESSGKAVFNPQVFDGVVLDRLNEYFQHNLVGITTRSKKSTPDQQQFLERRAFQKYPQSKCIHQLFEDQVALTPQALAVVFESQQLTYSELNDRANQVAHYLQTLQVGAETLVGISVERSLEMIVGLLGILKAGGAYVPLDPAYPEDRLAYILEDAQVSVLLTTENLAGSFVAYSGPLVCLDQDWPKISAQLTSNLVSPVTPDNLAYIIYTSGSTGKPKGVLIPHSNVGRLFEATQDWYHFDRQDVWTMFHSYAFDFSVWEIWGALIYGGKLVIVSFAVSRSPQEFLELLQREQVTVLNQTPSAFRQLLRVATGSNTTDKLSLRLVIFGGEALDLQSLEPWFAKYSDTQPQLVNMYGITETTVHVTYRPVRFADLQESSGSVIGCPIPDLELYILDEERQQVGAGIAGEMYVGGAGVARGYLNRPELTTERFIQNPWQEQGKSDKLYKTGDLARYLPNGDIEYLGRIDNQVKLRGFRIELGEIEAVINQHPVVEEAVVMVREDQPGDQRLVAYLVTTTGVPLNIAELRESLKQQLPDYMVPAAFMGVESIPLTTNGKVDRSALPPPQPANFGINEANFVAAGNSTEEILTRIWAEILQLDQVGVEDNFFDLGGNSLLGLRVIAQIQERFELKVSVVRLYQYSTVRSMGQYLAKSIMDFKGDEGDKGAPSSPGPFSQAWEKGGRSTKKDFDSSAGTKGDRQNAGVAVIGMVGRFPGANSVDELWENLCAGREAITFFEKDEISEIVDPVLLDDPNYVRAKGVLAGAELFDAGFFQISAREAEMMDPQARIFLELAHQALENAGYVVAEDNKIGVYAGSADNTYFEKHLSGRSNILDRFGEFQTHLVNDRDYLPTKASYKLNLKGPSISISTACSTSLVAIIQAYQGLLNHQCDVALAGGVSIMPPQNTGYLYQEGSIFTPDGHCRPFDANAQGTSFNNGAGIVVLKRLEEAIADGDRVYAVIKGVGINNDGSDKVSFTAPSISGQMGAILQAQQEAGVDPASISYIEAHGTATPIGDPIEVEALTQAFRTKTAAKQFCGIGSIKSNLGHLTAAAGVAGFIKTVLALYHRQIPPSINFDRPNPYIDFANSPFYVNSQLKDWPTAETPRRAGVSSFGGGGTNAHVILEESLQTIPSSPSRPYQLLLLSGKTTTAIEQLTTDLQEYLQRNPDLDLADIAYTLQQGRRRYNHRRFVVCHNSAEAVENLATLPPHLTNTRHQDQPSPNVVFMFPGQGSQYVNMGINLYRQEAVFQQAIDSCAEILQPLLDQDIRELIYPEITQVEASSQLLEQTRYTQPALFTIEYALAKLWQSWGIQPQAMVGHSIGEFVAACLAGVFSLADALQLVAARGKLMWDLPAGSMLSVRMPVAELETRISAELSIAAINSRSLCVVSGATAAIEQLQQVLTAEEVVCKLLHTSHAFHSAMMEPIVAPFAQLVASIPLSPPQIPFVSTTTATWITNEQATDPNYWAAHLRQPVRFADAVQTLWQHNPSFILLEVGPRQVLSTLARQQVALPLQSADLPRQIAIASQGNSSEENKDWQSLMQSIGQLWLAGVTIDWQKFYTSEQRQRLPLPTYPFEKQRFWIEPLPARASIDYPVTADSIIHPQTSLSNSIMPLAPSSTPEPRPIRLMPLIAEVLQDTAGVEIHEADHRSTFLELGLDSLSLTQVALALKKKFKVPVTFRQLLEEYSTLTTLVQLIDRELPPDAFPAPVATTVVSPPAIVKDTSEAIESSPFSAQLPTISNNLPIINPVNISSDVSSSAIESLVQQQLQIMARQLELLGGNGAPTPVAIAPIPSQPAPVANADHNGNGKGNISKPPAENLGGQPVKAPAPGTKINRSFDHSLTAEQQIILQQIIARYVSRTAMSKQQAQEHRRYLADPRTVSGFTPWLKEMVYPIVTNRAKGSRLWDEDGNEYIDLTNGFGLNFFGWSPDFVTDALKSQLDKGIEIGPQTALAGKVAKMITEFTGMERVAFCNTGSEAVMAAFRIARTVSGRDRVVIFADSYHGTFDEVLVRGGANLKSFPAAPGLMPAVFENILVLEYGSDSALATIREYADEIAAVIVEPIQSRHPQLQPREFLKELRKITAASEIALIFDEVVNGFRVAPGGAQEFYGIRADIATYGKVVGGGLPIGILTGSSKYMDALDGGFWQFGDDSIPEVGVTFFAGTFVRHPLALAAVEAVLTKLKEGGAELQVSLANKAKYLVNELIEHFKLVGAPINVEYCSSFFYLTFPPTEAYGSLLYYLLREKGIHIWEFRPCFLTLAHSDEDIEKILWAFKGCLAEIQSAGFLSSSGNALVINQNLPPQPGAKMGKDRDGNPAWFIADPERAGKYLQIEIYG